MELSTVFRNIKESQTLKISAKAKEMIKNGEEIINLAVGEPDFDTPQYIKNAAIKAIEEDKTKYTDSSGIVELREEIAKKLMEENNIPAKKEEIVVTNGAKEAIYSSLLSILNPEDEVMIIVPYFTSYIEVVRLCRANPVLVNIGNRNITKDLLNKYKTEKTKLIMICSPNNPDGKIISEYEYNEIKDFVLENNIYILSDEIYENIIFRKEKNRSFASNKEIFERGLVITINGFSKAFNMTGWRLGYVHANQKIIGNIKKAKGHISSNTSSISQYAGLAALKYYNENKNLFIEYNKKFLERRDRFINILSDEKSIKIKAPEGSFYIFIEIKELINKKYKEFKLKNDMDICNVLLSDFKLAITPGSAFGNSDFVRISFAADIKEIEKAGFIIKEFLSKLY